MAAAARPADGTGKSVAPVTITDDQLVALAQQRADLVEQYLIATHGIERHRLISCQSRLDTTDAKKLPRTELTL